MKDKYYKYFNPNPEGHEDACDCVVRALCAATGLSWYEVYDKCCEIGKEYGVMPNASGKRKTAMSKILILYFDRFLFSCYD